MDITQFIETYGKPAFKDLLNIIFIHKWQEGDGGWRMFCLRHKMITRNTKTVRVAYVSTSDSHWYYGINEEGNRVYQRWEQPQKKYRFWLKNGSGKTIVDLLFTQEQLEEWKRSETNPNHR